MDETKTALCHRADIRPSDAQRVLDAGYRHVPPGYVIVPGPEVADLTAAKDGAYEERMTDREKLIEAARGLNDAIDAMWNNPDRCKGGGLRMHHVGEITARQVALQAALTAIEAAGVPADAGAYPTVLTIPEAPAHD